MHKSNVTRFLAPQLPAKRGRDARSDDSDGDLDPADGHPGDGGITADAHGSLRVFENAQLEERCANAPPYPD